MKKIITVMMCLVMVLSIFAGCSSGESETNTESATSGEETEVNISNDAYASKEGISEKDGLSTVMSEYVNQGILTQEEADELITYLQANEPSEGSEGLDDPLSSAVEQGLISQEQADAIELPEPNRGEMGDDMKGGPEPSEDMLSVDEANEIEAQLLASVGYTAVEDGYPIVDTNQTTFFSNDAIIDEPAVGDSFYGQDASFTGNAPSYTDNGDGTVTDNVTELMWQQDPGEKMTWEEAVNNLDEFNEQALGGYSDWRIPTIKELYSLVQFSGSTRTSSDTSTPYIDTEYFVFLYGDEAGEPRFIDSQILTSTIYDSTTLGGNTTVFGYNFADGRIKGYEITKDFYCYYVRGNTNYGQNLFVDNGNETITDEATNLMWMQYDTGFYEVGSENDGTMNWEEALNWVQEMNEQEFLGYSDWRLPNIKELQSIVDYSKSPITTDSPAIDDLFYCTPIVNCFGDDDYGYFWSSTTHDDTSASTIEYNAASYVVFGNAMGTMDGEMVDAHGSGSQKSDPKTGEREDYPAPDENAPQGDEQRVYNMVRLVRDAK